MRVAGLVLAVGIARFLARNVAPRLMETMMTRVMPRMMNICFSQMPPERREFMLTHCRAMLDEMDRRYPHAAPAAPVDEPAEVA